MGNIKLFVTGFNDFENAARFYSDFRGPFNLNGINSETILYELANTNTPSLESRFDENEFLPNLAKKHASFLAGVDTVWFTNFIDHLIDKNEYEPCGSYLLNLKMERPDLKLIVSNGLGRKNTSNEFYKRVVELDKTINSQPKMQRYIAHHRETPEIKIVHGFYDFRKYLKSRIDQEKKTQGRLFNPYTRFY